jgi:hypothetical protein
MTGRSWTGDGIGIRHRFPAPGPGNDGRTALGVSSLTVTGSTIIYNWAKGGERDDSRNGQGIGGGVYPAEGSTVYKDARTVVFGDFTILP